MTWQFGDLKPLSYDLIMADPPWATKARSPKGERKSAAAKYKLMPLDEIAALPVYQLAAPDCVLFLWGVWNLTLHGGDLRRDYRDADASRSPIGEIIRAWGFRYATGGCWRKTTINNKVSFGTGYRVRSSCEPFFIGIIGNPKTSRGERNIFDGLRRAHSQKPDEAYAWCERYFPNARRLELFSRSSRPGWDAWGDEAGKFDEFFSKADDSLGGQAPAVHRVASLSTALLRKGRGVVQ